MGWGPEGGGPNFRAFFPFPTGNSMFFFLSGVFSWLFREGCEAQGAQHALVEFCGSSCVSPDGWSGGVLFVVCCLLVDWLCWLCWLCYVVRGEERRGEGGQTVENAHVEHALPVPPLGLDMKRLAPQEQVPGVRRADVNQPRGEEKGWKANPHPSFQQMLEGSTFSTASALEFERKMAFAGWCFPHESVYLCIVHNIMVLVKEIRPGNSTLRHLAWSDTKHARGNRLEKVVEEWRSHKVPRNPKVQKGVNDRNITAFMDALIPETAQVVYQVKSQPTGTGLR